MLEIAVHVTVPIDQLVSLESKDRLHRITKHAGRQHFSGAYSEGVLDQRTILVLVDEKPVVGRG